MLSASLNKTFLSLSLFNNLKTFLQPQVAANGKPITAVSTRTGDVDPNAQALLSDLDVSTCTEQVDLIMMDLETVHVLDKIILKTATRTSPGKRYVY